MYVGEIYGYKPKNEDSNPLQPAREAVQIHYVTRVWNLYTENRCTFDDLFQNTKRPKDKKKFTFRALGGVVLRIAHIKAAWKQLFEQCLAKGDRDMPLVMEAWRRHVESPETKEFLDRLVAGAFDTQVSVSLVTKCSLTCTAITDLEDGREHIGPSTAHIKALAIDHQGGEQYSRSDPKERQGEDRGRGAGKEGRRREEEARRRAKEGRGGGRAGRGGKEENRGGREKGGCCQSKGGSGRENRITNSEVESGGTVPQMTHFSRSYFFFCTGGDRKEKGRNQEGQRGTAR